MYTHVTTIMIKYRTVLFSSIQSFSCVWLIVIPWTVSSQASLSRPCSNSYPLSQWYYPTISSSVIPISSHLQSFPASGSFPMSQFFTSGGQGIGVSTSASILPMNIQDWFPLGLTSLISLQSKGLSRVFSNTTVWKHLLQHLAFIMVQLTSIHNYWKNHSFD